MKLGFGGFSKKKQTNAETADVREDAYERRLFGQTPVWLSLGVDVNID